MGHVLLLCDSRVRMRSERSAHVRIRRALVWGVVL